MSEKLVIAFDMCSSSNVLEDLKLNGNVHKLLELFDKIGRFLNIKASELNFLPHKFVGDGWILLFPLEASGDQVLRFLTQLCQKFNQEYQEIVKPLLDKPIAISGLTFGIDVGELSSVSILNAEEYVGRPINIACRLQSAIKDKDATPQYKALISRPCFNRYFKDVARDCSAVETTRNLRNIRGGDELGCVALSFTGATEITPVTNPQNGSALATRPAIALEPFFREVVRLVDIDPNSSPMEVTKSEDWFHLKIRNLSPFTVVIDTIGFAAGGKRIPAKFTIETPQSTTLPYRLDARDICIALFWVIPVDEDDLSKIDEVYVETGCGSFFHCKSDLISRWKTDCTKPVESAKGSTF